MSEFAELRRELTTAFAAAGIETAAVDADLLIMELARFSRLDLFMRAGEHVPAELEREIRALAERRKKREPLQYLLGYAYFMDLKLRVSPDVLIPRPETEVLVEWVLERLPHYGSFLDIGTGSGAIALSVAYGRKDASVTALDVSSAALSVARSNAGGLKVRFLESDLFAAVAGERFDLIAANLPYVTDEEYETLTPEVRLHEPRLALTAPDAGMALIERTAAEAAQHLKAGGQIIFELSPPQAPRLAELLRQLGFREVEAVRDLVGRERFITGLFAAAD